jgi:hypothetical protein
MKTLLTFLLLVLTIVLAIILLVPAFIYTAIRSIKHGELSKYFYKIAFSLDQLGNIICQDIFNDWWIHPNGHRMGSSVDQTISFVLGTNLKNNTLYPFGIGVSKVIDFFAYLFGDGKNHCLRAANNNQNNNL